MIRVTWGSSGRDRRHRGKWNKADCPGDAQALGIERDDAERVGSVYRRDEDDVRIDVGLIADALCNNMAGRRRSREDVQVELRLTELRLANLDPDVFARRCGRTEAGDG